VTKAFTLFQELMKEMILVSMAVKVEVSTANTVMITGSFPILVGIIRTIIVLSSMTTITILIKGTD
jgi:hypothetical protein